MTRYILFNNAPTTLECLASIDNSNYYSSKWNTTTFQFESSKSEKVDARVEVEEEEQRREAENGRKRDGNEVEERKKKPRISWEGIAGGGESTCQSFFMFPPPSQPRKPGEASYRITRSQLQQPVDDTTLSFTRTLVVTNSNETTTSIQANLTYIERSSRSPSDSSSLLDDSSSLERTGTSDISIGAPPRFLWKLHDLTKLDQLGSRLTSSSSHRSNPTVSILAVVSVVNGKDTSVGRVTELVLEDETGSKVKLVSWGEQGVELTRWLRVGDVVYFGKVRLKRSKFDVTQLEVSLIDNTSQVGIAYRTRVIDPEDEELYQFHSAWSRTEAEARVVLEIVDWWRQNRET